MKRILILMLVALLGASYSVYGQGVLTNKSKQNTKQSTTSTKQVQSKKEPTIGELYEIGDSLFDKKSYEDAITYYKEAAEKGHPLAQSKLGMMYFKGIGVEQNFPKAVEWFQMAVDQEDAMDEVTLGTMYLGGLGVEKDVEKGKSLISKAADSEFPAAEYMKGQMYELGFGYEKNLDEAYQWYIKSSLNDWDDATNKLVDLYDNVSIIDDNVDYIIVCLDKPARKGNVKAQAILGDAYYRAHEFGNAEKWLKSAIDNGSERAQKTLDLMNNPRSENKPQAAQYNSEPDGQINGHGYVDLGLPSGLKWATCNIGASSIESNGDYFAWGETTPMFANKETCLTEGMEPSVLQSKGITNDKGILMPDYDAAHVNWGGTWRMPTKEECKELVEFCTWTLIKSGKINGYRITGPNGRAIFFPTAGDWNQGSEKPGCIGELGNYFSSTSPITLEPLVDRWWAFYILFNQNEYVKVEQWQNRENGCPIRPVSE